MQRVTRIALQRSMRTHNPTIYLFPSLFKQRSATQNGCEKASNCNRFVTVGQPNSNAFGRSVTPQTAEHA